MGLTHDAHRGSQLSQRRGEMEQKRVNLNGAAFSCSICLDLLDTPVTIPCGHSYCLVCIKGFWEGKVNDSRSCPQCRETFTSEPALVKNTMLAALTEELQKIGICSPAAEHHYAGAEDVACDKNKMLECCP
uniref:RING-type domain-containing protein n=1 Tax=Oryzias sinensis TaxID=183150 RepID=A0A8C7YXL6_9TELE